MQNWWLTKFKTSVECGPRLQNNATKISESQGFIYSVST